MLSFCSNKFVRKLILFGYYKALREVHLGASSPDPSPRASLDEQLGAISKRISFLLASSPGAMSKRDDAAQWLGGHRALHIQNLANISAICETCWARGREIDECSQLSP